MRLTFSPGNCIVTITKRLQEALSYQRLFPK